MNEETPAHIFLAESTANTQPPIFKSLIYMAFNFLMQVTTSPPHLASSSHLLLPPPAAASSPYLFLSSPPLHAGGAA